MKKALIFQGGWDGHEPQLTSKRFAAMLEKNGIAAEIYDNHECFADLDNRDFTMSEDSPACEKGFKRIDLSDVGARR